MQHAKIIPGYGADSPGKQKNHVKMEQKYNEK